MKNTILLITLFLTIIFVGCDKANPNETNTEIRLKSGSGLNNGGTIYFLAFSKNENYMEHQDVFGYDKTDADWYIDGGIIPFTTDYKKFAEPVGEYYYLLKAAGIAMSGRMTVKSGKQTYVISAEPIYYGGPSSLKIDIEQP